MMRDVRHAWRSIRRMPGVAAVVVVSLGIGIGVNTAIFSWIQALVLQPIPGVSGAARFQLVEPRTETGAHPGTSWPEYRDLQERLPSFRELLAFRMAAFNVGDAGHLERTYGLLVSADYFSGLGLRPALGRFVRPDEVARPGGEPVVVISYEVWQARFSGAPDAPGRTLRVNGRPLTIVGVTPYGFQGTVIGVNFDLWMPATLAPNLFGGSSELDTRSARGYSAIGSLRPDRSIAQARAELDAAMRQLAHDFPAANGGVAAEILPFWQSPRGPQRMLVTALAVLQAVMLLLLLAVCANTANLVLARASTRQPEIGVRLALGAGRWRIVSLLLTENLLLALVGAGLGAAIAVWGTDALRAMPLSTAFPIRFQTKVDAAGLAFAAMLGVACGLLFGAAPALQLSHAAAPHSSRSGSQATARRRMRHALMGIEIALAMVVLLGAGLFYRSFSVTHDADPGFRRDGVLLAAYDLSGRPVESSAARDFAARLLARLRDVPGVQAAAIASYVPLDIHGMPSRVFTIDGRRRTDGAPDRALANTVTPGYFETMKIPLRRGRDFVDLDDAAAAPQAIVNDEFVRRYVGDAEPIGRSLENDGRRYTITGVAATSLYESFGEPPAPMIYFSYRDRPARQGEVHVRAREGGERALAADVRRIVAEMDPALTVYNVRTLGEHIETNLMFRRIPARMFVVLGPLLLVLAAIGIYAVVGYTVSQRTHEIGVRLALGATARGVAAQIVGESLRVIAVGALAGWLIALLVAMDIAAGGPVDVPVFLAVPIVLLLAGACACWLPAHRTSRVDPMIALRHE